MTFVALNASVQLFDTTTGEMCAAFGSDRSVKESNTTRSVPPVGTTIVKAPLRHSPEIVTGIVRSFRSRQWSLAEYVQPLPLSLIAEKTTFWLAVRMYPQRASSSLVIL